MAPSGQVTGHCPPRLVTSTAASDWGKKSHMYAYKWNSAQCPRCAGDAVISHGVKRRLARCWVSLQIERTVGGRGRRVEAGREAALHVCWQQRPSYLVSAPEYSA